MESFERQFNQPNLLESREEPKNFLLEGPELVSPEEERKQKSEMSFSFSSDTRRYLFGYKNGKPFFMIEYFDSLPDELREEEKEKFIKETRKQGEIEKTVYVLKYGDVPETKKIEEPDLNQSKKYGIAQPRDFERDMIDRFVDDDKNKKVMEEILAGCSDLNEEEIGQIVEQFFTNQRQGKKEAIRNISDRFPKEVVEKIRNEIKKQMLPKPEELNIKQLVESLKDKKILFYTGAGISIAGGVHGMDQLYEALGIDMSKKIDSLIQRAVNNPQDVVKSWKEFTTAAFENPATPAHKSLGRLAKKLKSQIFTENIDHLQEKAGVKAIHLTGPWLKENVRPEWLKDIDVVITIGLSYDDKGFLRWYKENNPKGKIIAINLNQPSYLGNEDFILKGDCQKVVPEIEKEFAEKE